VTCPCFHNACRQDRMAIRQANRRRPRRRHLPAALCARVRSLRHDR
jgi:hypothetical protein